MYLRGWEETCGNAGTTMRGLGCDFTENMWQSWYKNWTIDVHDELHALVEELGPEDLLEHRQRVEAELHAVGLVQFRVLVWVLAALARLALVRQNLGQQLEADAHLPLARRAALVLLGADGLPVLHVLWVGEMQPLRRRGAPRLRVQLQVCEYAGLEQRVFLFRPHVGARHGVLVEDLVGPAHLCNNMR